jgi:hypothetical protein
MCLHVLLSSLTEECEKGFIRYGGFRILKKWLQIAEEEDSVLELTAIVKVCKKLPFDEAAIRESAIPKSIKRLLKYKSPSGLDVANLYAQVESIMAKWRAKQQQVSTESSEGRPKLTATLSGSTLSLIRSISEQLVSTRGLPSKETDVTTIGDEDTSKAQLTINSTDSVTGLNVEPVKSVSTPVLTTKDKSTTRLQSPVSILSLLQQHNQTNPSVTSNSKETVTKSASMATKEPIVHPISTTSTSPSSTTVPTSATTTPRERKVVDMAEGARKLLAMQAQMANSNNTIEKDSTLVKKDGIIKDKTLSKQVIIQISINES